MSAVQTCQRKCSKCQKWKDESEFHLHGPGRRCRRCKTCISIIKRRHYRKVEPYTFTVIRVENPDLGFLGRQLSKVVVNVLKVNDGQLKQKSRGNLQ